MNKTLSGGTSNRAAFFYALTTQATKEQPPCNNNPKSPSAKNKSSQPGSTAHQNLVQLRFIRTFEEESKTAE